MTRKRPRRITRESGRALEVLGHAIEYLADEYAFNIVQFGKLERGDPRVDAVHLLMGFNREVYYACPEIEPTWKRTSRWASSAWSKCSGLLIGRGKEPSESKRGG
jgi:hypothetical protein